MFTRKVTTIALLGLTTVVLAAQSFVAGAAGRGVAQNQEGFRGSFNFEVAKKVVEGQDPTVRGRFVWEARIPSTNTHVRIEMIKPRILDKNENVVEFGGPAIMVIKRNNETRRFEGKLGVRVKDQKPKNAPPAQEPRDLIRVRFDANNTDVNYTFEGAVREGDIHVFIRNL